ncbi:MAG: acyl-CoA dehydrogenase family protein [Myxococcota bacterium]
MDLSLTEEDELLRDTVRELGQQRVRPHAIEWDEARALPEGLMAELGEMGLTAMELPEDEGGTALSAVAAAALVGELAAADGALALRVLRHNTFGLGHVMLGLADDVREAELPAMAEGRVEVAWALSEQGSTTDPGSIQTRAVRDGDHWVLDGHKQHVVGGATAGRIVVLATTAKGDSTADDIVALLVDGDADGLTRGEPVRTMGMRAAGTAHLRFEQVRVPASRMLGEPGQAWGHAMELLDRARIGMAALACGIGRGALQVSTAYAKEREQFGKPIASFQAIQWKLADMATTLEAAWLLTMRAAWLCDSGQEFAAAASRAKIAATTAATRGCSEALQVHGGYGYTREFPVEKALRDARWCESSGGTNEVPRTLVSQAIAARYTG